MSENEHAGARQAGWLTYAMLGCVMALWAGNAIVGRAARADIDPISLATLRWVGASLLVTPLAWRGLREDWPALRAAWKPVVVLCLCGIVGFNSLLYYGLQSTTATKALLMQATIPGLVLVFAALAFKTHEPLRKIAGIALSMAGALYTIFEGSLDSLIALRLGQGDLLVFGACVLWAIYTVLLRLAPKVRPASLLWVMFVGGSLVLIPLALLLPGHHLAWTGPVVLVVGYVAVFPSVVAYFLFNAAVARAGPAIAGQAIALMPLAGALLAALLLGEALHGYHAVGMVAILAGIVIAAPRRVNRAS
ncbi:DMT family transporter [Croceicoccus sp. BE223]|uniref:DMT family transporter n=1 Tax=Croceicoccus sp. BE223 TaxID=2817716 RepID=UPI0028573EB1|nr:DMT family transporter [Croceicoccus sp. BE223]MDR7103472.1 drug/metabolite transporter (DMT)-like permease [Croceicoccus sp. BE223]